MKEDEGIAAALQTLLRTVRDAEDLLAGTIDEAGDFSMGRSQGRALASIVVRLRVAIADGHRALREKHIAQANAVADAQVNAEWGFE